MKLKFPNLSFITANDISGIALKTLDNKIPKTAKFNKTMRKKWGYLVVIVPSIQGCTIQK